MTTITAAKKRGNATTTLTEAQVVDLIKAEQGGQSLRGFAAVIGVSAPYLMEIYRGTRSPGKKILSHFGIGKTRRVIVEYLLSKK